MHMRLLSPQDAGTSAENPQEGLCTTRSPAQCTWMGRHVTSLHQEDGLAPKKQSPMAHDQN
eukprot:2407605-Ditylum_brightwellii.AAC.1